MNTGKLLALGALSGCMALGSVTQAATTVWDASLDPGDGFGGRTSVWALNDAGTAWAEWNMFDSLNDSTPDVGSFGPAPQTVQELTGTAFLTGGGNIYSYAGATSFAAVLTTDDPQPGTRDVVLRLGTLGTALDLGSILLNGEQPDVADLLHTEALGGPGGAEEERLFIWNAIANTTSWQFEFSSIEHAMSLDQAALYAGPLTPVPLPAGVWLFGAALASLANWRCRRFHN